MADGLSEKKSFRLALPMGNLKVPKFLYIILITLGVLILIIGGFYFFLKKTIINNDVLKNGEVVDKSGGAVGKSNLEFSENISKDLILQLEKQRDDNRGVYNENEICENGVCSGNIPSNRSGFSVMDGKAKLQNKIDQSIIDDLKKYTDRNIVQVIQSNYLLCNFLYDLYSFPTANEEVKNLTEKICFDTEYEILKEDNDLIYSNKTTNVNDLLNQNLQKLENILIKKETTPSTISDDVEMIKKYSYFVSEFTTRYKWKNKNDDYKGFLISLDRFLDLYNDSNNEFFNGEGCALAMGLIDMADVKQIPELKRYGQLVYSRDFVEKDINKMTVRQMLTCGLLSDKLKDKESVNKILSKISSDYYNEDKKMVSNGKKDYPIQVYDTKNNGMFLILLSSIKESE